MDRDDLQELHYITPIENIPSIMKYGILSHRRAKRLRHQSIAMEDIQGIRDGKSVPRGRRLHEYVNLYIHARNPMMFKRRDRHQEISVLRISTDVLDLPNVVIADGNAASDYTAFWPSPRGLSHVNRDVVFAEYWTHTDPIEEWKHKRIKCAEVLVPDEVEPKFIIGVYVSCEDAKYAIERMGIALEITINAHLFFQD
ncbi:MAG: DUF4433 domain-containing protein [Deltaproteobacteria bacterium]|nr:DUF4433 domain-containing protein [Deltaproteobacteria bacterium]